MVELKTAASEEKVSFTQWKICRKPRSCCQSKYRTKSEDDNLIPYSDFSFLVVIQRRSNIDRFLAVAPCSRAEKKGPMEAFKKIYPEEYYRKFLVHAIRPDGRTLTAIRKTIVSAGVSIHWPNSFNHLPGSVTSAHGSSFVKIGSTAITCGIKAEVGRKQESPSSHLGTFSAFSRKRALLTVLSYLC